MKKLFLYTFLLMSSFAIFSCSDKDDSSPASEYNPDRLTRPILRTDFTVSKGSNDAHLCKLIGDNSIQLYWSRINGAKAYRLKGSTIQGVATGDTKNWDNPTYLVIDTVINVPEDMSINAGNYPDHILLEDLRFSATYRFAIQAIAKDGEDRNSLWFGIGDLSHKSEMCAIKTNDRYKTPSIIYQIDNVTKTSFRMYIDRKVKNNALLDEYKMHFNTTDDGQFWKVDYVVVEASESTPEAKVPAEYKKIKLNDSDFDSDGKMEIVVNNLDSNAVYNVYAYDSSIPKLVYAQYNLDQTVRTKGDPGLPITIEATPQDTMHYYVDDVENEMKLPIAATPIQPTLEKFMESMEYAENKVFYLRGGETYFTTSGLQIFKGFKLATHPDDIAAGKGRAKVYLYHQNVLDISTGSSPSPAFFMLGRMPRGSENPEITISIEKILFEDIDFAVPMARNIADGAAVVTNSYFMNMYAQGMGTIVDELSIKNCSFQGIVGGFYRVQANYGVRIKQFTVDNCDFYNGGYYNDGGRRYNYFHANPEANNKINIWEKFTMSNCTIYDNPLGHLFTHNKQESVDWEDDLHYDITLVNNTFVNFNTCNVTNSYLFNTRWIPGGSKYTVKRNLFVLTRQDGDDLRQMVQAGCDIRTINGSETVTLDFEDNYSTNDFLFGEVKDENDNITKMGQIFSNTGSAFDITTKNTFGALENNYTVNWGSKGAEGLTVIAAPISAKDLMIQPNPPHKIGEAANHYDHQEDGIDGTVTNPDKGIRDDYVGGMVDLHFKPEAKTANNVLYNKGIGAPKWRQ